MSEAKFTKGEWKVIKSGESFLDGGLLVSATSKSEDKSSFYFENEILIAATTNDDKEAVANAHLIAAGPEMYKEIEGDIKNLKSLLMGIDPSSLESAAIEKKISRKKKLLAKARGE